MSKKDVLVIESIGHDITHGIKLVDAKSIPTEKKCCYRCKHFLKSFNIRVPKKLVTKLKSLSMGEKNYHEDENDYYGVRNAWEKEAGLDRLGLECDLGWQVVKHAISGCKSFSPGE